MPAAPPTTRGSCSSTSRRWKPIWRRPGAAPVNVKFLIEGEEEVSSPNLTPFIKEHLALLKADVCVISDSSMRVIEEPAITHSLRGMTYMEIEVQGPTDDLHSGFWGGATHNPALALVEILGKLYNADKTIADPRLLRRRGGADGCEERAMIAKNPTDRGAVQGRHRRAGDLGRRSATPSASASPPAPRWTSTGCGAAGQRPRPQDDHPAKAGCKISSRLVGNQDPHKIYELVKQYIESITPPTVKVEVRLLTTGRPALIPFDLPEMQAAARAYEKGWGHKPIFTRGGGSIPVVADITEPDGHSGGDDGLWAGHRRPALAQRALQRRDVPARHRDGHRLS